MNLDAKVTLDDGTECALFDSEGNALIWYKNGGEYHSIRADDQRVRYKATYGFNVGDSTVGSVYVYEVSDMWINLDDGKVDKGNIVVFNLMDDDVLINEASNNGYLGKPVNCVKTIQWANKILEYAYLRLDTAAIQASAFNGCPKLKYVNIEEITELRQIGGGGAFSGCTALFAGQVVDLTRTKLTNTGGSGTFNNVPFAGIKFPSSVTYLGEWNLQGTGLTSFVLPYETMFIENHQFNNCKSLTTIYMSNVLTKIENSAFNNTPLEKVFFIGTLEQLNTLLESTDTSGNTSFWDVVGENRANVISYADYLKLSDKSGKYVVYNYSYCEAYNEGKHALAGVEQVYIENYFEEIKIVDTCTTEYCGVMKTVDTIGALFTYMGYSYTEMPINGTYSMSQFYSVNKENIKSYTDYTGNKLELRIVTSSVDNPIGSEAEGTNKVVVASINGFIHNYIAVKLSGITEEYADRGFVFCVFIKDNGTVYYLDNGISSKNIECKSYNDIKELIGTKG